MRNGAFKTENGIEFADTGDDEMLEEIMKVLDAQKQKNMEQSDSLRDKRMAGLPIKRRKK